MISSAHLLFGQITNQLPASPGSSPEHWATRTLIFGALGFFLVWLICFSIWWLALRNSLHRPSVRISVYFTSVLAAALAAFIASYFDVFKKPTYIPTPQYRPDWHVLFWGATWAAVTAYYFASSFCAIATKESEEFKSKQLAVEIASIKGQRDVLAKITSFANQMVTQKIDRFSALIEQRPITTEKFLARVEPLFQVQFIVKLIHEFYKPEQAAKTVLRLALWNRAPAADGLPERLVPFFTWDGEKENCFRNSYADRMTLVNPRGAISEIVKCYHSNDKIKIIPDCVEAERRGEFSFFTPEQKDRVKSMVLYKHIFMRQAQPQAIVLLLVSGVQGHFRQDDANLMSQFFEEMFTRIEMEWILLQIISELPHPAREA